METVELYKKFRQEIDAYCAAAVLRELEIKEITYNGETVGMLMAQYGYIDGLYILPEYRRKGLARKAVEDYIKACPYNGVRLHIVNANLPALAFWNNVCELSRLATNGVDTEYKVKRLKGEKV